MVCLESPDLTSGAIVAIFGPAAPGRRTSWESAGYCFGVAGREQAALLPGRWSLTHLAATPATVMPRSPELWNPTTLSHLRNWMPSPPKTSGPWRHACEAAGGTEGSKGGQARGPRRLPDCGDQCPGLEQGCPWRVRAQPTGRVQREPRVQRQELLGRCRGLATDAIAASFGLAASGGRAS
jgi:hypothetical protein